MLGCTCDWSFLISIALVESATTCIHKYRHIKYAGLRQAGQNSFEIYCCNAFSLAGYMLHEHRQIGTLVKMYCTYKTYQLYVVWWVKPCSSISMSILRVSSDNVSPNINSGVASDRGAACWAWEVQPPLFIPAWQCSDDGLQHTFHPCVSWQHPTYNPDLAYS